MSPPTSTFRKLNSDRDFQKVRIGFPEEYKLSFSRLVTLSTVSHQSFCTCLHVCFLTISDKSIDTKHFLQYFEEFCSSAGFQLLLLRSFIMSDETFSPVL